MWKRKPSGKSGGWNYRAFVRQVPTGEGDTEPEWFIGEAYYDAEGAVNGWTEEPSYAIGDNLDEIRAELQRMLDALDKPALDHGTGKELTQAEPSEAESPSVTKEGSA